jgi:hypothetical protein
VSWKGKFYSCGSGDYQPGLCGCVPDDKHRSKNQILIEFALLFDLRSVHPSPEGTRVAPVFQPLLRT